MSNHRLVGSKGCALGGSRAEPWPLLPFLVLPGPETDMRSSPRAEVAKSVGGGRILSNRRACSNPSDHQRKETTMSPLRERMIEDMTLAGLALGTRQAYTQAVRRLTVHYRRSPNGG